MLVPRHHLLSSLSLFLRCHIAKFTSGDKYKFEIRNYSKSVSKNKLNNYPPKDFVVRMKQTGYSYIKDIINAECIASHLCSEWKNGYILEANPGPGFLTKAILNTGVSHLRVFEKNEEFLPILKDLSNMYKNLEIISEDIMCLPTLETKIFENETNISDSFFVDLPENQWKEGIGFRFFSVINSKRSIKFIRFLLAVLPTRSSIFSHGRCEFFLLIPETEYLYMIAEPKENFSTYRWITVLYNLFFEIKSLQKYSSNILQPTPTHGKKKASKEQYFYLVQLTPKADLFSFIVNDNKLPDLYFFVRHHLMKRTGLVIPTMEGWIPSCGPRLIKDGMNVFTKFGDLSPKQILLLFNQFSSWPEYEDSTFCAALQRFRDKGSFSYEDEENFST